MGYRAREPRTGTVGLGIPKSNERITESKIFSKLEMEKALNAAFAQIRSLPLVKETSQTSQYQL